MLARAAAEGLKEHQRDCAEFRRDLRNNQERAAQERQQMHAANQNALQTAKTAILVEVQAVHSRVDRLYNRAWAIAFGIMGLEGAALIYFIKQFMDKVQP